MLCKLRFYDSVGKDKDCFLFEQNLVQPLVYIDVQESASHTDGGPCQYIAGVAKEIAPQKINKQGGEAFVLEMVENPDVAATIGKAKKEGQTFVGFAAETNDVLEHAQGKLHKKNLDMIVANNLKVEGAGFGTDTNVVTLITKEDCKELELMSKADVAEAIVTEILEKSTI